MWRFPRARPTSWPTMMPPKAGEMTVSHSRSRNLSASRPQTSAAISVCCRSSAHWKNCRLWRPDRKTKWPSRSAPVRRNSASKSSLIWGAHAPRVLAKAPSPSRTLRWSFGEGAETSTRGSVRSPEMREILETETWRLTRRIAGRLSVRRMAVVECDRLDLHACVLRQGGNAHRRTRGRALREVGRVNFVHLLEIAEVRQEHRRLYDVGQGELLRFQDRRDAIEHPPGLLRDIFGNDLAGFWIERDLSGAKDQRAGPDRLRVRPDRCRSLGRGNDLLHPASLAGKGISHNGHKGSQRRFLSGQFPKILNLCVPL